MQFRLVAGFFPWLLVGPQIASWLTSWSLATRSTYAAENKANLELALRHRHLTKVSPCWAAGKGVDGVLVSPNLAGEMLNFPRFRIGISQATRSLAFDTLSSSATSASHPFCVEELHWTGSWPGNESTFIVFFWGVQKDSRRAWVQFRFTTPLWTWWTHLILSLRTKWTCPCTKIAKHISFASYANSETINIQKGRFVAFPNEDLIFPCQEGSRVPKTQQIIIDKQIKPQSGSGAKAIFPSYLLTVAPSAWEFHETKVDLHKENVLGVGFALFYRSD